MRISDHPYLILVCKNTQLAKMIYEWIAERRRACRRSQIGIPSLRNVGRGNRTIRVDSKVIQETDTEGAKSDEMAWMRLRLDTVGKQDWPRDDQGRRCTPRDSRILRCAWEAA